MWLRRGEGIERVMQMNESLKVGMGGAGEVGVRVEIIACDEEKIGW